MGSGVSQGPGLSHATVIYFLLVMKLAEKIVKILEELQTDVKSLHNKVDTLDNKADTLEQGQKSLIGKVDRLEDGQGHMDTALKNVATKQDVEDAVDAAKSELKADILMLDSKVVKKIQSLDRRTTNIEDQSGIENPEKH